MHAPAFRQFEAVIWQQQHAVASGRQLLPAAASSSQWYPKATSNCRKGSWDGLQIQTASVASGGLSEVSSMLLTLTAVADAAVVALVAATVAAAGSFGTVVWID